MNRRLRIAGTLIAGIFLGGITVQMLHAQQQGYQRTELYKTDSTGSSNTEVMMGISEYQPGTTIPRHLHYGDEFVYVMQGATLEPGQSAPPW
jgi:quercetin dioxygenase-like cupin family protein